MREGQSKVTYLKDYTVPDFLIDTTDLRFELEANKTRVTSTLALRRNSASANQQAPLKLHGDSLSLISLSINDVILKPEEYVLTENSLTIHTLPESCTLTCITEINPEENLALEGLYLSDGMFCTQCEAEGFRRITYYLDRPDVMSVFTTTVIANKQQYPILLSNGNPIDSGILSEDASKHYVSWHDPHKKPCYLFALVAGNLAVVEDQFTTMSGRKVALQIFVENKDIDKCDHAMLSLKRSMQWDEEVYGREYDLDLYMIVAVDFFNMGAMENKGLNIFNTSCVLAHPKTQTDAAFQRVEAVIAHEYFHNWSGNRVTCRDWFQLSLKEGFTVFRDASFSADMNSANVKRIEDVSLLRSAQFAEDAGPMSHPIRPNSFIEISNFYTLTIYEKGAEVIRMIYQLLGAEKFRAGSDLYFNKHDGQAVTCEDFIVAMEEASGVDLSQFRLWYSQSGTPELVFSDSYDAQAQRYTLTVKQSCPPSPGQPEKEDFLMPLKVGLLDKDQAVSALSNESLLILNKAEQSFNFEGISKKPIPSLMRGLSAPVKFSYPYSFNDLLQLLEKDTDGFVRWDAAQQCGIALINQHIANQQFDVANLEAFVAALRSLLQQAITLPDNDYALTASLLELPSLHYLIEQSSTIDIDAIGQALSALGVVLAQSLQNELLSCYELLQKKLGAIASYRPIAEDIAMRSLKNRSLSYLMKLPQSDSANKRYFGLCYQQFSEADNMTDQLSALTALVNSAHDDNLPAINDQIYTAINSFYVQWKNESLVVNQWLSVQACSEQGNCLATVKALQSHEAYDPTNPNKVRALIGAFCMRNLRQFHAADGSGYALLSSEILRLDKLNPQLASRLITPLTQWRRYDEKRIVLMKKSLQKILAQDELSNDVFEVVSKSLESI